MKTVIEMAREATLLDSRDDWNSVPDEYREAINAFAELVRADEREAVIGLLKGIDKTEIESADGWWETSSGAEFGAGVLDAIRARSNT